MSEAVLDGRGPFGDLRGDGFRITRWDAQEDGEGRHWFDSNALVLCLNVTGRGQFRSGDGQEHELSPGSMVISSASRGRQHLERIGRDPHRFVVLEMRRNWMNRWFPRGTTAVRRPVRHFLQPRRSDEVISERHEMPQPVSQIANELLQPPGSPAAWPCWHHAKALEVVSHALFINDEQELFCERTKRVTRERIQRVKEILTADLENPPALAELGKKVGCSPFYLSRVFRQETGVTISAFLRQSRMERAAELLRSGKANVTEAALTVGYSSLSHFSKAFAETYGCCPCFYGRKS